MDRRSLLLISSPALLIGLILVGACAVGMVAVNSFQNRIHQSLERKVQSLRAAHEMEVALLRLRIDSLVGFADRSEEFWRSSQVHHQAFERAVKEAKDLAIPEQAEFIARIEQGYDAYRAHLKELESDSNAESLAAWAKAHPIQQVVAPCQALLVFSQSTIAQGLAEVQASSKQIQLTLLLLGVLGPAGGIIVGYAIARPLSRSIARLQVQVQDVHSQVAPEVGVVDLGGS